MKEQKNYNARQTNSFVDFCFAFWYFLVMRQQGTVMISGGLVMITSVW
jgi:hypothetical protein